MNNKGLTLVELLGVLVVLTVILSIATPIITRDLKRSRIELCNHELDSFIVASKNWLTDQIDDNYSLVYESDGTFKPQEISVLSLYDGGYITEPDSKYKDVIIQISKSGDSYSYTLKNADVCK